MFGRRVRFSMLPYRERTQGKFADLRQVEITLPRRRWVRVSVNGQYRSGKKQYQSTRYANPGWVIGTQSILVQWTHFKRHCWHFEVEAARRGITLSYGRDTALAGRRLWFTRWADSIKGLRRTTRAGA